MALIRKKIRRIKNERQSETKLTPESAWNINPYDFVSDSNEFDRQEIEAVKQGFEDAKAGRTLTRSEMSVKLKDILKH